MNSIVTRGRSSSLTSVSSVASSPREEDQELQQDLDGHKLYHCSNKGCNTTYENADELTEHLMVCDFTRASTALSCVHCSRTFRQVSGLIEHLRNIHGPKRFTCGICPEFKVANLANMHRHFKSKHKTVSTMLKPVDPFKNNQELDKFIVLMKPQSPVKNNSPKKISKLNTFSPTEIDQLPKQPIFQTPAQCSECNFSDRVRTNIIRHLKSHTESDKEVTKVIPINPMPCLESKEKYFDKMTNWAGSSHKNADGSLKPVQPKRRCGSDLSVGELEELPKFIPATRRYVCGAESCAYLTTDLEMLTLHVKNLHAAESFYSCPHCPNLGLFSGGGNLFERGLAHLKLHGDRLYRCSICQYNHHNRKVAERHLAEKHGEYPESVLVIREPDLPETGLVPQVQSHTWMCSECGFSCASCDEIKLHCKTEHNIKSQYRCTGCPMRSSGITTIEQHFLIKHPNDNVMMYASYYRSDSNDNNIITGVPTVETEETVKPLPVQPIVPNPIQPVSLDNVRHIRQILIEEVESPTPRTNNQKDEKKTEKRRLSKEGQDSELISAFGPFGKPDGQLYCCPVCKRYKNRLRHNLRDHLFREFQFKKYQCKECPIVTANRANLQKHLQRHHQIEKDFGKHSTNSKANPQLEAWVARVISHQTELLTASTPVTTEAEVQPAPKSPAKPIVVTPPKRTQPASPTKSLLKNVNNSPKMSLLKPRPSPVKTTPSVPEKDPLSTDESNVINIEDSDSDERPLMIDEEEEVDKEDSKADNSTDLLALMKDDFNHDNPSRSNKKKSVGEYVCKHCKKVCKKANYLKMHIRCYHLRLGGWNCGHCKVSTHSEQITVAHCRSAHPDLPVSVEKNPETGKILLTDEFWEKEYGIKKRESPTTENTSAGSGNYKCRYCDYTTHVKGMLSRHEPRHWVQKPHQCGYCNFEGIKPSNVKIHSMKMHPGLDPFVIDRPMPSEPEIRPLKRRKLDAVEKKQEDEDFKADCTEVIHDVLEEMASQPDEEVGDDSKDVINTDETPTLVRCFYCPLKATKVPDIHKHWIAAHKNNSSETSPLPFRYKSIPTSGCPQTFCCGFCSFKGPLKVLRTHFSQHHPGKEFKIVGVKRNQFKCSHCAYVTFSSAMLMQHNTIQHTDVVDDEAANHSKAPQDPAGDSCPSESPAPKQYKCLWCQELCENLKTMELHNTFFHSHLEPRFESFDTSNLIIRKKDSDTSNDANQSPADDITITPVSDTQSRVSRPINPNRRLFICPECPEKTLTLRVMRSHVAKNHVKEYQCPQCNVIIADLRAAGMHMFVEHPNLDLKQFPVPKSKEKIDHMMLFVKREGDDEQANSGIPEFQEISITDILNPNNQQPQQQSKKRCVAKKSTTPRFIKNTARKSFPRVVWELPDVPINSDTSEYESDASEYESDDEGHSIYMHPSVRPLLPSLSQMSHLRTEMPFGQNTIKVTVAQLALLVNMEPVVKVKQIT